MNNSVSDRRADQYERQKAWSKRKRKKIRESTQVYCVTCGREIKTDSPRKLRFKYCENCDRYSAYKRRGGKARARTMRHLAKRRERRKLFKQYYHKPCKYCGTFFKTTNKCRLFCQDRCRINDYRLRRYAANPQYKLEKFLRGIAPRLGNPRYNQGKRIELLGCSLADLQIHIERQFRHGWNWSNHGPVWEIDHRIPLRKGIQDTSFLGASMHFLNLQPIAKHKNRVKKDKEIFLI